MRMNRDPVPYITAEPLPSNILEWHYVVCGPENTPYEGGYYHGKLVFPREFPFKPPSIYMITPSGRFKPNTRLCLSISDFHPDNWNPAWSVSTILTGLLSFMNEKSPTVGSIETTDYQKRQLAYQSLEYNIKNNQFKELFPEITTKIEEELAQRKQNEPPALDPSHTAPGTSEQSTLQSCVVNLVVFVVFACFAFVVKHVMVASAGNATEDAI